jgi:micrococcal nuclease
MILVGVLVAGGVATFGGSASAAEPTARAAATCSDYSNQADAQRAADTRDADGDGIYCEDLPCPCLKPGSGGGGGSPKPSHRRKHKHAQTIRSRITRVVDGDTIKVRSLEHTKRKNYTVRLIGIDTPETKKPGTPIECGGKEATSSMFDLSFTSPKDTNGDGLRDTNGGKGRKVTLVTDPTQATFDRYHRLLAYVTAGGRTFEGTQLGRGWAKVYVFKKRFRRYHAFRASQTDARDAGRGVWELCGGHFHRPA